VELAHRQPAQALLFVFGGRSRDHAYRFSSSFFIRLSLGARLRSRGAKRPSCWGQTLVPAWTRGDGAPEGAPGLVSGRAFLRSGLRGSRKQQAERCAGAIRRSVTAFLRQPGRASRFGLVVSSAGPLRAGVSSAHRLVTPSRFEPPRPTAEAVIRQRNTVAGGHSASGRVPAAARAHRFARPANAGAVSIRACSPARTPCGWQRVFYGPQRRRACSASGRFSRSAPRVSRTRGIKT
jgi:hypothetical protein